MGYNIIDIINKSINIAVRRKAEYEDIGKRCNKQSIKIMSVVLVKQLDKSIQYYEKLKKVISGMEFEEIDFVIYDKMSFLIDEFNRKVYKPEINNVRDYLKSFLDLEKDVYSLLVDVQGRFVKNTSDVSTKTYTILSHIINNEASHISTLEKMLK
ncbi:MULTISPECIES: hypothetical protein [Clostridium]|uniref:Rubrerythrin diiron-binding domain-containing protein n=5 Tax=Clostridium TaxID=1485 RepID=D8GUA9_CLOLD|nr:MULTISPECIES: hypothetical protein [Clostridium]ADK14772.1 conserved hypothetical protein [Clostridium ljungdahlii DSM 13528]AGY78022.1 hypothetical protein CAETHG_3821 [Clostridium autoethanogenum DSM 10061]ALU38156.1 Hypothetical protein CLAU_3729 [Clostridium autoethanogenum DSM 10061]OAA85972.1 hypothetical protein WX45_00177 [Clostridium ljungdahlii DSM 13528]OAA92908.1 hypothetical protein WX73_00577 [Clostridium coskatii]